MQKLKTLFKKTSTGAIQQWDISVEGTTITTTYGQVGGKLQTTKDPVKTGKSIGKKNETSAEQQAMKEAEAKWLKQKKAGYSENLKDAESGKTDSVIEGGIVPMLAKVFEDHSHKLKYPVMVQPKLDGHRCIAQIDKDGKVTLWTRTRKRITSVPHIEAQLEIAAKKLKYLRGTFLDGELYNHELRDKFEELTSAARKKEPSKESEKLQYHIYDMVLDKSFENRLAMLSDIILVGGTCVTIVETFQAGNEHGIIQNTEDFIKDGYEGAMVRQLGVVYENKRSDQLLKVKKFQDAEFEIVGVEEGRGKLIGHAGAFVCKYGDKEFNAKMAGSTDRLKTIWENKDEYIGKLLTVKFQGLTSDGIPRFPVGMRMREDL